MSNYKRIKELEDKIVDLQQKLAVAANFTEEKDRLLSTIALLVYNVGGVVLLSHEQVLSFSRAWSNGEITLEVNVGDPPTPTVTLTAVWLQKGDNHNEQSENG